MTVSEGGTVLVVDDDREVVRTYRRYLESTYTVREAYDGEDALAELDDDVDVVLLDRLMPGLSGEDVLDRIREEGYDVRVAMVTAIDPDFDIVDMGFDAYVTKPATREELLQTVDDLLTLDQHAVDVREYHSLLVKASALQEGKSTYELEEHPAYADLESRIADLEATLESETDRLTDDSRFVATLRAIDTSAGRGETDG